MELTWSRLPLRLKHPFRTATALRVEKETILVRVHCSGIEGLGEAAPTDTFGQTPASAEHALAQIAPLLASGTLADPLNLEEITAHLLADFGHQRAALAAIDGALHDWIGKRFHVPTVRWLGLNPTLAPPTSLTIGIDAPAIIEQKLQEAAEFPILKIKVAGDQDADYLARIRKLAPTKTLRVDANTAWTSDNALANLRRLADLGVEFVEQPLPASDMAGLRRLKDAAILPIIADESCVIPADVVRLAGCVDGINIKLAKCGGIREATRMIHLARGLGLKIMLGCMIESSLGIAQLAQLASLADWIDLDGHLLLAADPFAGLGSGPRLQIGNGPGLGVQPAKPLP